MPNKRNLAVILTTVILQGFAYAKPEPTKMERVDSLANTYQSRIGNLTDWLVTLGNKSRSGKWKESDQNLAFIQQDIKTQPENIIKYLHALNESDSENHHGLYPGHYQAYPNGYLVSLSQALLSGAGDKLSSGEPIGVLIHEALLLTKHRRWAAKDQEQINQSVALYIRTTIRNASRLGGLAELWERKKYLLRLLLPQEEQVKLRDLVVADGSYDRLDAYVSFAPNLSSAPSDLLKPVYLKMIELKPAAALDRILGIFQIDMVTGDSSGLLEFQVLSEKAPEQTRNFLHIAILRKGLGFGSISPTSLHDDNLAFIRDDIQRDPRRLSIYLNEIEHSTIGLNVRHPYLKSLTKILWDSAAQVKGRALTDALQTVIVFNRQILEKPIYEEDRQVLRALNSEFVQNAIKNATELGELSKISGGNLTQWKLDLPSQLKLRDLVLATGKLDQIKIYLANVIQSSQVPEEILEKIYLKMIELSPETALADIFQRFQEKFNGKIDSAPVEYRVLTSHATGELLKNFQAYLQEQFNNGKLHADTAREIVKTMLRASGGSSGRGWRSEGWFSGGSSSGSFSGAESSVTTLADMYASSEISSALVAEHLQEILKADGFFRNAGGAISAILIICRKAYEKNDIEIISLCRTSVLTQFNTLYRSGRDSMTLTSEYAFSREAYHGVISLLELMAANETPEVMQNLKLRAYHVFKPDENQSQPADLDAVAEWFRNFHTLGMQKNLSRLFYGSFYDLKTFVTSFDFDTSGAFNAEEKEEEEKPAEGSETTSKGDEDSYRAAKEKDVKIRAAQLISIAVNQTDSEKSEAATNSYLNYDQVRGMRDYLPRREGAPVALVQHTGPLLKVIAPDPQFKLVPQNKTGRLVIYTQLRVNEKRDGFEYSLEVLNNPQVAIEGHHTVIVPVTIENARRFINFFSALYRPHTRRAILAAWPGVFDPPSPPPYSYRYRTTAANSPRLVEFLKSLGSSSDDSEEISEIREDGYRFDFSTK